jgi:hypothetical protein
MVTGSTTAAAVRQSGRRRGGPAAAAKGTAARRRRGSGILQTVPHPALPLPLTLPHRPPTQPPCLSGRRRSLRAADAAAASVAGSGACKDQLA